MSLEEFRRIKKLIMELHEEAEKYYSYVSRDKSKDEEVFSTFIKKITALQDELLSSDLSEIPFEEWNGLILMSEDELDFSKTHANLDFSLLAVEYEHINLSGCNVRGLQKLDYDADTFSPEFMREHPEAFPDESLPEEIRQKFFDKKLTFIDLFEYPSLRKCVSEKSFMFSSYTLHTKNFIDAIGYENAIKFFDEYPEFTTIITTGYFAWYNYEGEKSYESIKKYIFKNVIDNVKANSYIDIMKSLTVIPQEMKDLFPEVFINSDEIPDDIYNDFYAGKLTIRKIRNNKEFFKDKDLKFGTRSRNIIDIDLINDIFGSIWDYLDNFPMNFDFIIDEYLNSIKNFPEKVEQLRLEKVEDVLAEAIEYSLNKYSSYYSLYEFYLFSKYLPIERLFKNEVQRKFIQKFGLKNLVEFNHNNNMVLDKNFDLGGDTLSVAGNFGLWKEMSKYLDEMNDEKITSKEDFISGLRTIILNMRKSSSKNGKASLYALREDLMKSFPEELIDYDLLTKILKDNFDDSPLNFEEFNSEISKKLLEAFNGNFNYLLVLLNNYPYLLPVLDDKIIIFSNDIINNESINILYENIGNGKFLEMCSKYGLWFSEIIKNFDTNMLSELINSGDYEDQLNQSIYDLISLGTRINTRQLPKSFKDKYPKLFIDKNAPEELQTEFYNQVLDPVKIQHNPEWVPYLMNVDLSRCLKQVSISVVYGSDSIQKNFYEALATAFSQEEILKLLSEYGMYLSKADFPFDLGRSKDEQYNFIIDWIYSKIKSGREPYNDTTVPKEFKVKYPEMFLDENAPDDLKKAFYGINYHKFNFEILAQHKEDWLPYLKEKYLILALFRNTSLREQYEDYFNTFGSEKGFRLGIQRSETVTEMIKDHQVELMKSWYDKTGGKFIPDYVVMTNFRFNEADKFLVSKVNWSQLMRIRGFSETIEARDAMLKIAYSFGAFDHDSSGFKKVIDLLTGIPREISSDYEHIMNNISFDLMEDSFEVSQLRDTLVSEGFELTSDEEIFSKIYRKNEDGSYSLRINPQSYPKSTKIIRSFFEKFPDSPVLTPNMAHRYFGDFKLEYNPEFREFFLKNYKDIMANDKYLAYISAIQRRFNEIKTVYSNVTLTLDLAISYISVNKYENVNTGNERVTKTAALQNYSQHDFEELQRIYNIGKQRVVSSIPRIENEDKLELPTGVYFYEILRLDDPRAMSIGFESSCCQRLNGAADSSMRHSMTNKHGRVFIIKNEDGEVVAQSWVWRNKDVLCFDNIEVPNQKMWDNGIPKGREDDGIRNQFTDDILSIYKIAAHELMVEDEKVYRELLDSGKITQEQYDGLHLGKITAGLGFSNIKGSLLTLPKEKGKVAEPISAGYGLYTKDSRTQFILEEREDRKEYDGDTLALHNDSYIEYDDSNFDRLDLISLEHLEMVTKDNPMFLETSVSESVDEKHLVTALAKNYRLNPETTRIIKHPNFAIIYDINDDIVRIADFLFNTKVERDGEYLNMEGIVLMQIKIALEQIANDRKIDISELNTKQREMYEKAINISDELDIERGIKNAK